jgi:hypothetical protein
MRPTAWFAIVGLLGAGCDALLGIPSQEVYESDGAAHPDATIPADAAPEGAVSHTDAGQDATLADGGQDASHAADGDAVAEGGPDCASAPNYDWASWPMPNSTQDVEAGSPNPASYTDNHDGTVTDNVTGLMWQQSASTAKLAWSDAGNFCKMLTLAGHADWRLPSYIELVSLIDNYGDASPAVNATYFPGTPLYPFWSSTRFTADPKKVAPQAWFVDLGYGETSSDDVTGLLYARCVRGTSP